MRRMPQSESGIRSLEQAGVSLNLKLRFVEERFVNETEKEH